MIESWFYALLSVFVVSLVSFIGVFTLSFKSKSLNKALLYFVSFSAGALFGDVFLHLLPEIIEEAGSFSISISFALLLGIVLSFIIEKIIQWRHCHHGLEDKEHVHDFAVMNLVGDGVHNFIDGIIIATSYLVSIPIGVATTLAVIFHEIPQEIGDFGVLLHGGYSKFKALFLNFVTALTAFLGVGLAMVLSGRVEGLTMFMIPFAAGTFIYIAGSDLIPELHKEVKTRNSLIQLLAFLLGIGLMYALLFFH